jgi:hypothetical protein
MIYQGDDIKYIIENIEKFCKETDPIINYEESIRYDSISMSQLKINLEHCSSIEEIVNEVYKDFQNDLKESWDSLQYRIYDRLTENLTIIDSDTGINCDKGDIQDMIEYLESRGYTITKE